MLSRRTVFAARAHAACQPGLFDRIAIGCRRFHVDRAGRFPRTHAHRLHDVRVADIAVPLKERVWIREQLEARLRLAPLTTFNVREIATEDLPSVRVIIFEHDIRDVELSAQVKDAAKRSGHDDLRFWRRRRCRRRSHWGARCVNGRRIMSNLRFRTSKREGREHEERFHGGCVTIFGVRALRYTWLIGCVSACNGCRDQPARRLVQPASAPILVDVAAPIAITDASDEMEAAPENWLPSGTACRHGIPHGATLAQVHDDVLTRAIVRSYDRKLAADADFTQYEAIDCRSDRITYQTPLRVDAGASTLRVTRTKALANRIGVYVQIAEEPGYSYTCIGFDAVVRLDPDEIIVEGVKGSDVYECAPDHIVLVPIDGSVAMLVPKTCGTGENGDVTLGWDVEIASNGTLRVTGSAFRGQGAGNGSGCCGKWFPDVTAEIVDAGSGGLQIEETWKFIQHSADENGDKDGPTRKLLRTYTLGDGGLARSPAKDPVRGGP